MATCLLLIASCLAADAIPVAERLYEGATYAVWQERMRHIQPTAMGSERLAPGLTALVRDRDVPDTVRREAALLLARMGSAAPPVIVPTLIAVLEEPPHDDAQPRAWAAKALTLLGPRAAAAAPALCAIVRDRRQGLADRRLALEPLAAIGAAHPDVTPLFAELLAAVDPTEQEGTVLAETAADVAANLGGSGEPLVPLLVRLVRNPQASNALRRNAVLALGAVTRRGEIAGPALAEALVLDAVDDVRDAAALSLGRLGPAALPILERLLHRDEPATRRRALTSLAALGPAARPLEREIAAALNDDEDSVRLAASLCWLAAEFPAPAPALETLAALLGSEDRTVRVAAARRLEQLGPRATPVRAAIAAWTRDPRPDVRRLATRVVEQLAPP